MKTALREVRVALLEADVSLNVVRDFVKAVQDKATGQEVTKSVTPGQQVIKIVHDELVHVLAGDNSEPGQLKVDNPPAPILMVGLQGSGKTTTSAKLAKRLKEKNGKRVLMAIRTLFPFFSFKRFANFADVVVLPDPCKPTIRMGAGGLSTFN